MSRVYIYEFHVEDKAHDMKGSVAVRRNAGQHGTYVWLVRDVFILDTKLYTLTLPMEGHVAALKRRVYAMAILQALEFADLPVLASSGTSGVELTKFGVTFDERSFNKALTKELCLKVLGEQPEEKKG